MDKMHEHIDENLQYLKLPYIYANYKETAKHAARKELGHLTFLNSLIEGEVCSHKERSIERKIKNAKLPCIKTLEQYNWNYPKKINRMQVENLFRLNFIEKKENVIFLGPVGCGKTHMTSALAEHACQKGYSVLFAAAVDIINNLTAAVSVNSLDRAIRKYLSPAVLCIDELGFLPIDKQGANLLFQVISKRYETGSIILTSNRSFKEWPKIFNNDSTITSAVLDRLLHHCEVVLIEGDSYRMKDRIDS
jgi:DNA replication protein DnaC